MQQMQELAKTNVALLECLLAKQRATPAEEQPAGEKGKGASWNSLELAQMAVLGVDINALQASAESAAPADADGDAAMQQVEVQMNTDGECEAVALLGDRDLGGCLACIRASGHQVVVVGWV